VRADAAEPLKRSVGLTHEIVTSHVTKKNLSKPGAQRRTPAPVLASDNGAFLVRSCPRSERGERAEAVHWKPDPGARADLP
jgi:hypothetical protein